MQKINKGLPDTNTLNLITIAISYPDRKSNLFL